MYGRFHSQNSCLNEVIVSTLKPTLYISWLKVLIGLLDEMPSQPLRLNVPKMDAFLQ